MPMTTSDALPALIAIALVIGMAVTFPGCIGESDDEDGILGEDEYIGTDKELYQPREKVTVEVKNDGSGRYMPILTAFGIHIEHLETENVVFRVPGDHVLPAIPGYGYTESFTWNQTDQDGRQVPEGTYRVKGWGFNHTTDFTIRAIR